MIELHHGFVDRLVEVFGAGEGQVGKVIALHIAPSLFDVIESRGILGSQSTLSQCTRCARAAVLALLV